ncbi:MAG TPA: carbon-nitrogen hydrolase family protein [Solirubrobacteraceae bacterium]
MHPTVRAAAIQLNSTEDIEHNLDTATRLVRQAADGGAELIVLPEKWTVLGRPEVMQAAADPIAEGRVSSWAQALAGELRIDLVAGSFVEARAGEAKSSNTSLHYGADGGLRGIYRKLHMFDVEVDGTVYAESEREQAGEEIVVSELASGARLGMSICYDLRFPELYRELSERGAEVIAVPSAFTLATTRDHWEVLLRARAIENQCFVVAANQIGAHPPGNRSGGRSMIVDPWGVVLATAADAECAIVAELDFERLREVRRRLPALEHRRHDVYQRSKAWR